MLLRVPADAVRGLRVDVDLEEDRVVLAVAPLRVQDLVPVHKVAEAPVVLFAKKQVLDLAGEVLHALLLAQELEVRHGVAGPGGGLRLPVTLEEEAEELLGGPVLLRGGISWHHL